MKFRLRFSHYDPRKSCNEIIEQMGSRDYGFWYDAFEEAIAPYFRLKESDWETVEVWIEFDTETKEARIIPKEGQQLCIPGTLV